MPLLTTGAGRFPNIASWTPASLSNLKGWYEADGTLLNGSAAPAANNDLLSQWNDQSGLGNHLLAASIGAGNSGKYLAAGLNGKKTVYFDPTFTSAMHCTLFPMGVGNKGSCYVYGSVASTGSLFRYFLNYLAPTQDATGANSCSWARVMNPITTISGFQAGSQLSSGTVSSNTGTRFGSSFDGTNNTFIVNGVAQTPSASSFNFITAGDFVVGASDASGGGSSAEVYLSGIIVTADELTGTNLTSLDAYFAGKWN